MEAKVISFKIDRLGKLLSTQHRQYSNEISLEEDHVSFLEGIYATLTACNESLRFKYQHSPSHSIRAMDRSFKFEDNLPAYIAARKSRREASKDIKQKIASLNAEGKDSDTSRSKENAGNDSREMKRYNDGGGSKQASEFAYTFSNLDRKKSDNGLKLNSEVDTEMMLYEKLKENTGRFNKPKRSSGTNKIDEVASSQSRTNASAELRAVMEEEKRNSKIPVASGSRRALVGGNSFKSYKSESVTSKLGSILNTNRVSRPGQEGQAGENRLSSHDKNKSSTKNHSEEKQSSSSNTNQTPLTKTFNNSESQPFVAGPTTTNIYLNKFNINVRRNKGGMTFQDVSPNTAIDSGTSSKVQSVQRSPLISNPIHGKKYGSSSGVTSDAIESAKRIKNTSFVKDNLGHKISNVLGSRLGAVFMRNGLHPTLKK